MARRKKEREGPSGPAGAREWIVTFTDMISLLVTFFVLLMTFSSLDENEVLKVASFLTGERGIHDAEGFVAAEIQDDLLSSTDLMRGSLSPHSRPAKELAENIEAMGQKRTDEDLEMDLAQVADGLVIEFGTEESFRPGSAAVSGYLEKSLGEIGRVLEHYPYLVVVEGFTDGAFRATPTYPTVDDLAFARGAAAAQVLLRESNLPPSLVQISSHGDRLPRADEKTAVGRQQNRRVQLRVISLSRSRANHLEALEKRRDEEER